MRKRVMLKPLGLLVNVNVISRRARSVFWMWKEWKLLGVR